MNYCYLKSSFLLALGDWRRSGVDVVIFVESNLGDDDNLFGSLNFEDDKKLGLKASWSLRESI